MIYKQNYCDALFSFSFFTFFGEKNYRLFWVDTDQTYRRLDRGNKNKWVHNTFPSSVRLKYKIKRVR